MALPKPVIFILSEFFLPGIKKEICNINSCFPSQIKTISKDKIYVEGGMILLRLDKNSIGSENEMRFEINYDDELEKGKKNVVVVYSFKKEDVDKQNYFSDSKIETAIGLFYFAKFNRRFMKICNNESRKKKYDKDYIKSQKFQTDKENIKKFVEDHSIGEKSDNLNDKIVKQYLEKMENNVKRAIKYCNIHNKYIK